VTAAFLRRIVLALLLAALVLATTARCPRNWETWPTVPASGADVVHVPCRPVVVAGRAECTGTADIPPGTRLVIYEPATGAEAAMVRRQILDARGDR
jgi:hypothetical protein